MVTRSAETSPAIRTRRRAAVGALTGPFLRRLAVVFLAVSLLAGTVAVSAPVPAVAAVTGSGCPSSAVPATAYTDTVGSTHRAAIDCLTWWGLTRGRTPTVYGGDERITRAQTAAMIARLLERTGDAPQDVPSAGFPDTSGHRFADEIDLLAHLGIVQGTTAGTFDPAGPTTRAQMATVLVRTLDRAYGLDLPAGTVPFTDVRADDVHRSAIGTLVGTGITTGTTATTFHPGRSVNRAQMASFLTRSTSLLVDEDRATVPTERPAADDPYASAIRGTWVHLFDATLKSRGSIRAMVDELVSADINTVIVQVARRHDAYYDSEVLPATLDPQLTAGLDVLEELLPLAHARGIEVHAWFGVAPHWHGVYADLGVTPSQLGADVAWRTRTYSGSSSTYLDPGLPEVQRHVADVVGELASDYDLDGIHLDYVRYESREHGYHPDALARFRRETGATGTPAPTNTAWSNWRRSQTRTVIDRARQAARAADPQVELSAATISWLDGPTTSDRAGFTATRSYLDVLQDWDDWARAGRLETLMPMNYFRAHVPAQATAYERWLRYERALSADTEPRVVPGIAGYLNRPAAARQQIRDAMRHGDGAVVYSYQQPTDDGSRAIWAELARTRWGYPPIVP